MKISSKTLRCGMHVQQKMISGVGPDIAKAYNPDKRVKCCVIVSPGSDPDLAITQARYQATLIDITRELTLLGTLTKPRRSYRTQMQQPEIQAAP